jgi:hypothetical protein
MKNYVIYNSSGEVLRCGSVHDSSFTDIRDADTEFELVTDWPYDVENYHVVDGALVQKPQEVLDQKQDAQDYAFFIDQRNGLLAASDWTQVPDGPLTDAKKQEWATYRQALRDLPANTTDPSSPTWPTQPS